MRLLFDHNLSPRLVNYLQNDFPDSSHVALLDLERSSDQAVWQYAKTHSYIIVSKDTDFNDFVTLFGFPPKVIWLRVGNCTTSQVLKILQTQKETLHQFSNDPASGLLLIV
ncbi:MAG: DUF5615 family PIN-like protein [Candidatus Berkelbacteria bacterium]|nr:DUF5615 family PIN-like protein [Candidatus Berkelbacteria bacterium]MCR4307281.1 DUF5615 family PIN-like protein [Candidatus Berkelbacteria bacterium]